MRNLQQTRHRTHAVEALGQVCYRQDDILSATLDRGIVHVRQHGRAHEPNLLASFDAPDVAPDEPDMIIDLHFSEEEDSLCIIMQGGDIIVVQLDGTAASSAVEIIGSIDKQVLAAQWSPDNDILAIATQDKLSLLTKTYDSLAEVPISVSDIKASANQVSVGWGRVETQFRGKHAPRDPTLPDSVDEGTLVRTDTGQTRLSWRGDAAYLSMTTINSNRRVIRVYTRDGALESTSEPVNGQGGQLTWKPSGNVIATVQQCAGMTHQCIFFEKNGLRHGEFDLRRNAEVLDFWWNCDSTVLAVLYPDLLELWTASNYHYSLKSSVECPAAQKILWHPEVPLAMVCTSLSNIYELSWRWNLITHKPSPPNDFGLMAMVDGTTLGLTPLRIANVPPPMSFRQLQLRAVPRDVAISDDARSIFVLTSSSIDIYTWDLSCKPIRGPQHSRTLNLPSSASSPLQLCVGTLGSYKVLLSDSSILCIDDERIEILDRGDEEGDVLGLLDCGRASLSQSSGGLLRHLESTDKIDPLPETCHTLAATQIEGTNVVLGLSPSGKLYANSRQLATKVTSFLVMERFLMYTTSDFLRFTHLAGDLLDANISENDERSRQIERGSTLVCTCPSAQSVTLQAPRGNLETIYPRLLVLSGIRKAISERDWTNAWRQAKIHRIDVNIMYDHNPDSFFNNLREFILALSSSLELDIFLSGLKAEDVTATMYKDTSDVVVIANTQKESFYENKISNICDKVLQLLQTDFAATHSTSILTCSLSKSPPDYESALLKISTMEAGEVDAAITHVCFLADAHLLYNQALGLYDLPLALLLAQRSQKDPREYVPFLQNIQTMTPDRQHFALDDHLGRSAKALKSLLMLPDCWEETTAYIQRHKLWQEALELLRYDKTRNHELMKLYAEDLLGKQEFLEAAYAFELTHTWVKAMEAFEAASLWPEAIQMAVRAGKEPRETAERMVERMIDQSKFSEAATIYQEHLDDVDAAIHLHCRAYSFSRAILLASSQDKIECIVKPGLTEAFVQLSELFSEMKTQLTNQLPRLRAVREKRDENPESYFEGVADDDTPDNVSLAGTQASTTASVYTRYTGMSAMTTQSKKSGKAKRRQERQRAKGKKGTIWEEEYLVNSIRRLVERLEQTRPDARNLVIGLVRCDMRENATEIQKSISSLIVTARANLDEVFSGILTLPAELQRTMGTKPELRDFERFTLC